MVGNDARHGSSLVSFYKKNKGVLNTPFVGQGYFETRFSGRCRSREVKTVNFRK